MSTSSFLAWRTLCCRFVSTTLKPPTSTLTQRLRCSTTAASSGNDIIEDFDGRPAVDPVAAAFFSPSVQVRNDWFSFMPKRSYFLAQLPTFINSVPPRNKLMYYLLPLADFLFRLKASLLHPSSNVKHFLSVIYEFS